MSKFTPIPWTIKEGPYGYNIEPSVCFVGKNSATTSEQLLANAHLIAAAPVMYEFVDFFTTVCGQAYLRMFPADIANKIFNKANQITRKARGRKRGERMKEYKDFGGFGTSFKENISETNLETPYSIGEHVFFFNLAGIMPSVRQGKILDVTYCGDEREILTVSSCGDKIYIVSTLCSRNPYNAIKKAKYAFNKAICEFEEDFKREYPQKPIKTSCGICKNYIDQKHCKKGEFKFGVQVVCDFFDMKESEVSE